MVPSFDNVLTLIILIVNVIGILANSFIVSTNLIDWAKGRRLNTCDRILVALGITCACFQFSVFVNTYISMKRNDVHHLFYVFTVLHQFKIWSAISSSWLTGCLTVFYCVKIVDFNHLLLIWFKLRITKVVPRLILGSVLGSLIISIPVCWGLYIDLQQNSTTNSSVSDGEMILITSHTVIFCILGLYLPLLFDVASITVILISLYRHTLRMRENTSGFSQPKLDAHFGAAKVVGSLLATYLFTFFAEGATLFPHQPWVNSVGSAIISLSNLAQAFILILGNAKLKQILQKMLSHLRK